MSKQFPLHLIRRSFSTKPKPPQLKYTKTHLRNIVNNFKKRTEEEKYRNKVSFYEATVQRLANAKQYELIQDILEHQKKYNDIRKEEFTARIISLYGVSGMFESARKLFDEMPELKCARTVKSFNALLGACVSAEKYDLVNGLFLDLPKELGIKRNVKSYNYMIRAFCRKGLFDLAVRMIEEMKVEGLWPSFMSFKIVFDAAYKSKRFSFGEEVWSLMEKFRFSHFIGSYNLRLQGLVSDGKIEFGMELVEEIKAKGLTPDVDTYNILFKAMSECVDGRYWGEAKRLYGEMVKTACAPNEMTFDMLLPFACKNNDFLFAAEVCKKLFCFKRCNRVELVQKVVDGLVQQSYIMEAKTLVQLGEMSDCQSYRGLLIPDHLINDDSGMVGHGQKLPEEMQLHEFVSVSDVRQFNHLLNTCIDSGKLDRVDWYLRKVSTMSLVKPDVVSYNIAVKAFCKKGSLSSAVSMLSLMRREGVCPDHYTFNTLLDGLYKKDRFLGGEQVWCMMLKYGLLPDKVSYCARLHGLILDKNMREAMNLAEKMKGYGVNPDVVMFNILFKGLCQCTDVDVDVLEEVNWFFKNMHAAPCHPDNQTFAILLAFACEKGDFQFGERLCRRLLNRRSDLKEVSLVQKVVDGLVRHSDLQKAERLVQIGKNSRYSCYHGLSL